jgi:molybdopterin synthase sulfur carrier subunit
LKTLAQVNGEVELDVPDPPTQRSVIDALEARYPVLFGTVRDPATQKRRPFVRFYGCEEDLSHELPDDPLPDAVAAGIEPFFIVGAMAGG